MTIALCDVPPETTLTNISDPGYLWALALISPNREKSVARHLLEYASVGVVYFLPYQATRTQSRNLNLTPIFPGYLFIGQCLPPENTGATTVPADAINVAKESKHCQGIQPIYDQAQLRKELGFFAQGTPEQRNYRPVTKLPEGAAVRFTQEHSLYGQTGVLTHIELGAATVFIKTQILGQVIELEVDPIFLEEI